MMEMNIRKAEMIYPGEMLPRLIGPRHRRSVFTFRRNRALSAHRKLSHRHRSTPAMLFLHIIFSFPFLSPLPLFSNVIAPFSSYRTVSAVRLQDIACLDRLEGLESTRMAVKRTGTYQSLVVNTLPIIRLVKKPNFSRMY